MTETPFPVFVSLWNESQGLATPDLHFRISGWLEAASKPSNARLLLMAFRNSGKSTLVGLYAAWNLMCNPEVRILVLAADHQLAAKMVRTVRRVMERHPLTPHLCPTRAEEWASDRFTVERAGTHRDPSMLAKGIGSNITGSRADIVICDDVEVPNTCDTALKRADLRERLDEIDFVITPGGIQLYVGTPHTYDTIYATGVGDYLVNFQLLSLPVYGSDGDSQWPERFPLDRIQEIKERAGPTRFKSQMLLEPADVSDARLDPDKLVPYDRVLTYREGNGSPVLNLGDTRLVSGSCFWDPSYGRPGRGDKSAIAAVFSDADGNFYLHAVDYLTFDPEAVAKVDEATQLCRQAVSFARRHYVSAVHIETNGVGKFLPGLFRREVKRAGLATAVIEHVSRRNKTTRILEAFDAVLASGRLHASGRVLEGPFTVEMRDWRPETDGPDDGLDAVAGCLLGEPARFGDAPRVRHERADARVAWRDTGRPIKLSADFDV